MGQDVVAHIGYEGLEEKHRIRFAEMRNPYPSFYAALGYAGMGGSGVVVDVKGEHLVRVHAKLQRELEEHMRLKGEQPDNDDDHRERLKLEIAVGFISTCEKKILEDSRFDTVYIALI